MAQARQSLRAVLPLHTHVGELQVRVHMVQINRHHASKTFFSFLGIARGKMVVPEIVQYNGRPRRDLYSAAVEFFGLGIFPLGVKNNSHEAQCRKVARISAQHGLERALGIGNPAFLKILRRFSIDGT